MSHAHHWIQTTGDLESAAARLAADSRVVLDTEFFWERTFYPILGLVQLALADGTCFLVDTVAVPNLSPLAGVLADPKIEKIVHDAPQDLMILFRASGAPARNVFDTRLAAGFAGMDGQTSLQNLLANLLGVQLPKGHTRTNWLKRPLSPEQLEYAVDDVIHMAQAEVLLREKARESGVEGWLDEELRELFDRAEYGEADPDKAYLRLKASQFMHPRHLAVLRALAAWRELQAREADLPRGFVAGDHELVSIAQVVPQQTADLSRCRELDPRTARRYGADLLAAVKDGLAVPEAEWPHSPVLHDERAIGRERILALQEVIRKKAEDRKLDPRIVASKADVVRLLAEGPGADPAHHRLLRGWRRELLGDLLAQV